MNIPMDYWDDAWSFLHPKVAVTMAIRNFSGEWLMILRDPKPYIWAPDHWSFCGGQVEEGEDLQQAAAREMREELGIWMPAKEMRPMGIIQERGKAGLNKPSLLVFPALVPDDVVINLTEGVTFEFRSVGRWEEEEKPVVAAHLKTMRTFI